MRVIAFISNPDVVEAILAHLGLGELPPPRGPPPSSGMAERRRDPRFRAQLDLHYTD